MKIRYSEIFRSLQGEGAYTGHNTVWIRLWGCPLSCSGFYQTDPTDHKTYIKPWDGIDFSKVTKLEDLPVLTHGCDSAYSHEKEFLKFSYQKTEAEIVDEVFSLLKGRLNPHGWFNMSNGQYVHLCFTGGEPLMNQNAIISILSEMKSRNNLPSYVTFETNGMYRLKPQLIQFLNDNSIEAMLSISPKLFSVSGEKDAVKESIIEDLIGGDFPSQLKFVLTDDDRAWAEMEGILDSLAVEAPFGVWIMPVGATEDQQSTSTTVKIVDRAIADGYHVSARVQNYLYGNAIAK